MIYSLDMSCQGASRGPFMSAETLWRARGMRSTSRLAPDCASSSEIASASSDAMAEGGDRKMMSERRPERRRSLRDVEMATSGGQVRTSLDRTFWGGSQMAPNSVIFLLHGRCGGFQGCSVGTDIGADGPEAGASMARPRRLPGSSEVRVGCPPLGRAERTFWVRLRPYRGWISRSSF